MLKNYFKIAWRNLINNKLYSSLNIAGLSVGLAVGLLILLWAGDELSFDRFHSRTGQIYRVNTQLGTGLSKGVYSVVQAPIATYGLKQVTGIENAVRINENNDYSVFSYKDKVFNDNVAIYADPALFKVFDYPLLKGNAAHPFPDDRSVVITATAARRYFGTEDPMGKLLLADHKDNFVVSGVLADPPENSFLKCDLLFSTELYNKKYIGEGYYKSLDEDWGNYGWTIFLQVRPGVSINAVEEQLTQINIKHQPAGLSAADMGAYKLQPLTDIHLYMPDGSAAGMQTVKIFAIVAALILLIASINYINLSTARALLRSKEVSVRKIIGAARKQLFAQFMVETLLFFFISLILAFLLMAVLMPFYNEISGKQMYFDPLDSSLWRIIGVTVMITLLVSSIYPAMLLSSFKPLQALKGKLSLGMGNASFRKVLVVCQFVFSIGLIIGTLIINRQLDYIRQKELGYDKAYVFSFRMRDMQKHYETVRSELLRQPGISDITSATRSILQVYGSTLDVDWDGKDPNGSFFIHPLDVDKDFLSFFKIQLAQGTGFYGTPADSMHFILNETAVKEAGIKNPVGKRFRFSQTTGTIIGIAKDFHFTSLKEKIQPFIFLYRPDNPRLFVKTTGREGPVAIRAVEKLWKTYNPGFPLEYTFMDETYNKQYQADNRTGLLFDIFTGIAILISCLGLFGLASYSAHAKVKEIGIRKVLGASVTNIIAMLSGGFIGLVLLSILIASPLAWWAMNKWLSDFAYRATIPWWIFAVAGGGALVITVLTVSYQSVRVALANPVKNLRSE